MDQMQMQMVFQMGGGYTFEVVGSSQVPTIGDEEKHAMTIVMAVSGSGDFLALQGILTGKTDQSTPSKDTYLQAEMDKLGFIFEYSDMTIYWSNMKTMKLWVTNILVPYWKSKMMEFNVLGQECILQLDAWKVH